MPNKDESQEQLRIHHGQSEWAKWSNRVQKLEEDVETYAFWTESGDITTVCDGVPAVHAALRVELEKAGKHFATLAEFAPKKGRKAR